MLLNNLHLPAKLIHPDLETVEIIDNIDYLRYQTQLGIKEQALLHCIIKDNENNYHRIVEIVDKGPKGPWWKFEFFNPMNKVELKFLLVEDELILNKLKRIE